MNLISNIQFQTSKYFETWWTIMARPIYFYTILKEEDWREKPLTFMMSTAWLLALLATLAVFILQYVPIGATLVEGISGIKFLIILPVLCTLIFVFFVITSLILGGFFVALLFCLSYAVGLVLHYVYSWLGGKGSLKRMIQGSLYSSAAALPMGIIFVLMVLTKYFGLDYYLFTVGFNFFALLMLIFFSGLWAIIGRKNYGLSKGKAWAGALAPIFGLLIFGLIFDKMILPKFKSWIT